MTEDHDCWGCGREASIDGTLGAACRQALTERRTDPSTPRLNAHIERLEDIYNRLCWNCEVEISSSLSGLCPRCETELRR